MLGERWNRRGLEVPPKNTYPWAGSIEFCNSSARHPVVRAVDFHSRDSAPRDIVANLRSSLIELHTRKERHGEVMGRIKNGMWRKPQHVLDVRDPAQIEDNLLNADAAHNWALVFSRKGNLWGKEHDPNVFLVIDSPAVETYAHKSSKHKEDDRTRTEIPGDADKLRNRKIMSVCVHGKSLPLELHTELKRITTDMGYPFFDLDESLTAGPIQKISQPT